MTAGTLTLFAITGSMLALKLAIMVLAAVLLARGLVSPRESLTPLLGPAEPRRPDGAPS